MLKAICECARICQNLPRTAKLAPNRRAAPRPNFGPGKEKYAKEI